MTFNTPNIFVGGTKAKAVEVNENFAAIKDELNKHSDNIAETKDIAQETKDFISESLEEFKDDVVDIVKASRTKFSVNSGPITEGNYDLLSFYNSTVTAKAPFSYSIANGELNEIENDLSLELKRTGYSRHNPAMTSNTAPSGTISSNFTGYGSEIWYKAFGTADLNVPNDYYTYPGTRYVAYTYPSGNYPPAGKKFVFRTYILRQAGVSITDVTLRITYDDNTEETLLSTAPSMPAQAFIEFSSGVNVSKRPIKTLTVYVTGSSGPSSVGGHISNTQLLLEDESGLFHFDEKQNVFINNGELEAYANAIHRQPIKPENPMLNDIWLNTLGEPLKAFKYVDGEWEEYTGTPLGSATFGGENIISVETFAYNQNGYNLNAQSKDWQKAFPDYTKGVGKALGVVHAAQQSGILRWNCTVDGYNNVVVTINGAQIYVYSGAHVANATSRACSHAELSKGDTYMVTSPNGGATAFYPSKGEN